MATEFDPRTLDSFAGAAAGHDGVLSDPSGQVVVKPCTAAEVAFYETAYASHPDFAFFMPEFMGTLTLGAPPSLPAAMDGAEGAPAVVGLESLNLSPTATHPPSSSVPGTAAELNIDDPGPLKGKKLDTDLHIVLENVTAGFRKPNILDLKLGAQLWDEDAKPDKRQRLDKVASETTSGSLGFRIAGMRLWQGAKAEAATSTLEDVVADADSAGKEFSHVDESNYRSYDKFYGRQFNAENVIEGFKEYLHVPVAGVSTKQARIVAQKFLYDVEEIQAVLESKESRMYSASILLVYEGDPQAFQEALEASDKSRTHEEEEEGEEDDEEEEEEQPKLLAVKLIDFAHAQFRTGLGPDENMLKGVRSTVKVLKQLIDEFKQ